MRRMKLRRFTRNAAVVLGNMSITDVAEVSTRPWSADAVSSKVKKSGSTDAS